MAVQVQTVSEHELFLRLKEFEGKFGLPSEDFLEAFQNGQLDDSDEFFEWDLIYAAYTATAARR